MKKTIELSTKKKVDIKEMTIRDVERTLKELGASDLQAKVLIAQIKSFVPDEPVEEKDNFERVTPTAEDYETLIEVLQDALNKQPTC